MPVEALKKGKDGKRWIQGIASTDDVDLQGEKVVQSGIDLTYFLEHGYINDDHKSGPEHKVGEPTEARVTEAGLWIKGFLFKGHERADHWWEFLNALEQSDANRKVGFSIQGKVVRRRGKSIMKCWLQDVAITANPVNTSTWTEIVKALTRERFCVHPWRSIEKACKGCPGAGSCGVNTEEDEIKALSVGGGGAALVPESLEGDAKVQTFKSLSAFSFDDAVQYLQSERGYSPATAQAIADSIFLEHGLN